MSTLDDAHQAALASRTPERCTALATLALAKEQRVANLLALAALLPADSMGSTNERAELLRLVRAEMELT